MCDEMSLSLSSAAIAAAGPLSLAFFASTEETGDLSVFASLSTGGTAVGKVGLTLADAKGEAGCVVVSRLFLSLAGEGRAPSLASFSFSIE